MRCIMIQVRKSYLILSREFEDIKARKLSVIGDTETRFAEDPVRMLRVVRFQAKLDLVVESDVISAINKYASLIEDVPAARMFEEILKLFHYQSGWKTWQALRQTPLTQVLFPQDLPSYSVQGRTPTRSADKCRVKKHRRTCFQRSTCHCRIYFRRSVVGSVQAGTGKAAQVRYER